jgi:hypothetical protein
MVKQSQPYHRGDRAQEHPLALLATLSNADKHRIVQTAFTIVGYDASGALDKLVASARQGWPTPVIGWWLASKGRLHHCTPWMHIDWDRREDPPTEVKVGGDLTTEIAFREDGVRAVEFPEIAEAVRTVLEAFMADFPKTEFLDE